MALGALSREAIERAIAEYDELGRDAFLAKYGFGRATAYALVVDGREYDPKAIAGVAYGFDHPEQGPMRNTDFSGGYQLRSAYQPAGFDVVMRNDVASLGLQNLLETFLSAYEEARTAPFNGSHEVAGLMGRLRDFFASTAPVKGRPSVRVRSSVGQGNWARVPWVAFLDSRVTTTTQTGVYPVLLFREDMAGVYVTLAQGVTELRQQGRSVMLQELARVAGEVRVAAAGEASRRGFVLGNDIVLGDSPLARDYTASTIAYKYYELGSVPGDADILEDLEAVLAMSDAAIGIRPGAPSSTLADIAVAFRAAVEGSGLTIPKGHGDRVAALMAAVATKPFVILAGMSGSGKTQLALRLGEWFGEGPSGRRFLPVAVRPDWTGPEALFGYPDALRPALDGRAAWFVPSPLEFMLRAADEPAMPYLLLLDEMNLAHVERYFSDFLSGVESRTAVLPDLVQGLDGEWRLRPDGDRLIPLPRNLVVIGTVNVDETTYQFSPKVLDRATTFEVRTRTEELIEAAQRPTPVLPGAPEHLAALVDLIVDDTWQQRARVDGCADALTRLHSQLRETDDEFGHRIFFESLRLGSALRQLGELTLNDVLDQLVLLKVLPRIHGSRRRVEPVLRRLAAFAVDPTAKVGDLAPDSPALPLTSAKVARMLRSVEIHQFVSFTD